MRIEWAAVAVLSVIAAFSGPPPAASQHVGKIARIGILDGQDLEGRETK